MIKAFSISVFLYLLLLFVVVSSCRSVQNNELKPTQVVATNPQKTLYGLAYLSVVPLRAEPNHRSEMVSQVLFGEYMRVLETAEDWCYIQLEQDSYKGWLETSQILVRNMSDFEKYSANPKVKVVDAQALVKINGKAVQLLKGTNLNDFSKDYFVFDNQQIPFSGTSISGKQNRKKLIEIAYSYLNVPYLWGGKTLNGVDCSGFTQMVYHINGYSIQRDASLQAKQGELVAFLIQAKAGDLAFFENEEGNITHVGIILDDQKIIHAAKGSVRIDSLDQEGIFNNELKKYTHHLRMLRSYF